MNKKRILAVIAILAVMAVTLGACAGASMDSAAGANMAPAAPMAAQSNVLGYTSSARGLADGSFGMMNVTATMPEAEMYITYDMAEEEWDYGWVVTDDSVDYEPVAGIFPEQGISQQNTPAGRKIITTFNLSVETMDFDVGVAFITSAVAEMGGYIENSFIQGRSIQHFDQSARRANFTVRIPANKIHQFVALVDDNYNVTSTNESSDDITDAYFDNAARLSSLENQEALLLALLEREGELEYIIQVHQEIAEVRRQIEYINSSLQRMDGAVSYSTAYINLMEVIQYNKVDPLPMSFSERVDQAWSGGWNSFVRDMQNWVASIAWRTPYIIRDLLGLLFWVAVFFIVRGVIRKRKGKKKGEPTFGWMRPRQKQSGAHIGQPQPPAPVNEDDKPE